MAGFEAKPESKKGNSPASGQRAIATLQRDSGLGAPAGLPLFLQRAPSPAADPYEREADRVASQVLSTPEPGSAARVAAAPMSGVPQTGAPNGQPLDASTRRFLEPRFGRDFSQVRIHHDGAAADSAEALHARAYTVGNHVAFGPGEYSPSSELGLSLLAHELAHVVQQNDGGAGTQIQRKEKPAAPPEVDPQTRFSRNAARLRTEALPEIQRGLDGLAPEAVQEGGSLALLLWATIEGAYTALRPPDGSDLPEFLDLRRDVLAGVTIQKFRGADLAGPPKPIEHIGDVGQFISAQTTEVVATVNAAKALLVVLGKPRVEYEDEETAVKIFRERPNPWQLAYLRAAIDQAGLSPVLFSFRFDNQQDLEAIFASQKLTLERGVIGPADRIGVLEPMPAEGRVRVLQAYGARELAVELYHDPSFYEIVLLPYNRGILANLRPEALIAAGTELAVEPTLLWGRYRMAFMAAEMTRSQFDRPYIEATPSGSAIAGTKMHYTVHWPVPGPPDSAWRTNTGIALWTPVTSMWDAAELTWTVEDDPAKGRSEESIETQYIRMETLTTSGSAIDREWPETGTFTVRCRVRFGTLYLPTEIDLRYAQPVVTEQEKVEISWNTMMDPRSQDIHLQTAETYGEFQKVAEQLGVTEDELAANPKLAGPLGLGMSYYPEFLLRDLRQQRADSTDERQRKKLGWQIDSLESAIERNKKLWGMRPIRALYVSSKNDRTEAAPLSLYIAPDPDGPRDLHYALRLWDFTLPNSREYYYDAGYPATGAIHGMLETFASQSPYPTGTVRFWVDSSVLPAEFLGEEAIPGEVIELHTSGPPWLERLAPAIVTLAAVVVGSAIAGPEVALTAFAIYGAITGLADIVTRLADGTFEFDLQTGLDILAIVGGVAAGISPVLSVVRGVGEVAWLGTSLKAVGVLQLGVMAGTHLNQIVKAVRSGDQNEIMEAVMSAIVDGAFVAVTHAQSKAGENEVRARGVDDPVFAGARGGYSLGPGDAAPAPAAAPVDQPPPAAEAPKEPAPMAREETPRETHEKWAKGMSETGLSPRAPAAPAGPPVGEGQYQSTRGELAFSTPEDAFRAYDEALARAGGREVGIYRNKNSPHGEWAVVVGDEHGVKPPDHGEWESALHSHPNPENVLTRRMPAPKDVGNTRAAARDAKRPITEFIDYPLPDGRRGLVAYTVEPSGRVTIKYEGADGKPVVRAFDTAEDYAGHYAERTTYVDPSSPEYAWMMRDVADFYSPEPASTESTAVGVLKAEAAPEGKSAESGEPSPNDAAVAPETAARPLTPQARRKLGMQIAELEANRDANNAKAAAKRDEIRELEARRDARLKAAADLRKKGFQGDNDPKVESQRKREHAKSVEAAETVARNAQRRADEKIPELNEDLDDLAKENLDAKRKIRDIDEQLHPEKYPKTTAEKGRIGEAEGHKYMLSLGYKFLGSSKRPRVAGARDQGLDGVYLSPDGKHYVVAEMKYVGDIYGEPTYGKSSVGSQKTKQWANANLDQAVGETMANVIRKAGFEYWSLRYDPPPAGGGVSQGVLDTAAAGTMR